MAESSNDVITSANKFAHLVGCEPWVQDRDVLSLKTFPSTSVLKYGHKGEHLCKCSEQKRHRSLFDFNRLFTARNIVGSLGTPQIHVCHNADNIWECKLPRALTGYENRVVFDHLLVKDAIRVLKNGTYWYRQLAKKRKLKESSFQRKMVRLLAGCSSPEGKENFTFLKNKRVNAAAVQRFRSLLALVDGLLMQVVLAFPGSPEFQDWSRIDQIMRSCIANCLDDYFKDVDPNRALTFTKVKDVRKSIKMHGFNPSSDMTRVIVPRELSAIRVALSLIRGKTPLSHYQVMIMAQTRACGVPPRAVYDRTLAKTKAILTTPSDIQGYKALEGPLCIAVDHFYSDLLTRLGSAREQFFETVVKEAKISLSDSGEFFTNTNVGGKLEAARRVLRNNPVIPEVDLHTGDLTGRNLTAQNSSQGEMLFHWACGTFRDRSTIYQRNCMSCRISLVAELAKYRTITVSTLQHALLLHPFSHMGLKILEAMPEDASGIGAANHAWNFFKRLSHKNPSASFLFNEGIQTSVTSLDWEQATDFADPYMAGAMLNRLSEALGVPKWYRETMLFALTGPRQVETLDRNGVPIEIFYTKRGVLMGDPVTKVVLHLHHAIGANIAMIFLRSLSEPDSDDESSEDDSSDSD